MLTSLTQNDSHNEDIIIQYNHLTFPVCHCKWEFTVKRAKNGSFFSLSNAFIGVLLYEMVLSLNTCALKKSLLNYNKLKVIRILLHLDMQTMMGCHEVLNHAETNECLFYTYF
jgi:hypothetical protein